MFFELQIYQRFFCHCAIVEKNEVGTVNDELETGEIGRIKGEKAVQTSEKMTFIRTQYS
jgi:hypothetical protein